MEVYILAGGKSTRMGEDKGLKLLNRKPMIQYSIDTLRSYFISARTQLVSSEIKIIANHPRYKKLGFEVIEDSIKEKGPLGGICTALENTVTNCVFIMSCDIPFITKEAIEQLISSYNDETIVVAGSGQKIQPLFGIYSKKILPELRKSIMENRLKMMDFLKENKVKVIDMSPVFFKNINTPEEFNEALKLLNI